MTIAVDHLDEARARLNEMTMTTGYAVGSPEWFDYICGEIGGIDADGLEAYAQKIADSRGGSGGTFALVYASTIFGACSALYAQRLVDREGAEL